MDLENSNPKVKNLLNSWIPVTPVKSILTQTQPICAKEQENQLGQATWLESERFSQEQRLEKLSTELWQRTQAHSVVACCDSTSHVDLNQGFDKWEEALTRKSRVSVASDSNAMFYDTFSLDSVESSENISLLDLLAFAGAPSATSVSASANAISPGNIDAILGSQIESNQLESGSCPNSSAETNRSCNYTADIRQYENLIPFCPSSNLNSPPRTTAAVLGSTIPLDFAPITPDQAKRVENRQVSGKQSECQRTDQAEGTHENEAATGIDKASQLHYEQSLLFNGSSCAAVSTLIQEDHNPDKGDSNVIDQNRTPQQKQRRKKHRPKVVIEGQPAKTRKPAISELSSKKENPTGKRKYVRRKGLGKSTSTPSAEMTSKNTHSETAAPTAKSCRKSLNFNFDSTERYENLSVMPPSGVNSESQAQDFCTTIQPIYTAQLGKPMEVMVKETQLRGIADDLTHSMNQASGPLPAPERNAPSPLTLIKVDPPQEKMKGNIQRECTRGKCQIIFSDQTHDKQGNTVQMGRPITQPAPRSPNDSNCSSSASLSKKQEARGLKRGHPYSIDDRLNAMGAQYNSVQAYITYPLQESNNKRVPTMHIPAVCKRKRTEKGHNSTTSSTLSKVSIMENSDTEATVCLLNDDCTGPFTSKTNCRTLGAQFSTGISPAEYAAVKGALCQSMLAFAQKERLTRKRSKGPIRVRDLASFKGIVGYKQVPSSSGHVQGFEISNQPNTYAEVPATHSHPTVGTRKRTKRNPFVSSAPSYIYNHQRPHFKSIGPPPNIAWESLSPIDAIVEGLKRLDIDKKTKEVAYQEHTALVPYNMRYLEQNALVIYQRDGTVVPFEGSYDPVKKRRSRAKVDLDEETTRVWKLLLENINSEGIDGTDEEKAKWWEEERRVFRGRADSFIARMHLVQGDRRFSQWKGSVVDSVIGVFLTQNVSDHLSSSAFMSLAAQFPLKSKSNCVSQPVANPDSCILDTEHTIKWQEDRSNQPTCNQSSINLHDLSYCEEKAVGDSNESVGSKQSNRNECEKCHQSAVNTSTTQTIGATESFMENQIEIDDILSSQNSVDSSIAQSADRMGAHLLSDSEADRAGGPKSDCFNSFTSFMELLLHKAGTSMLHAADNHVNGIMSSDKKGGNNQAQTEGSDSPKENMDNGPPKASLAPIAPFSNYQLHATTQQVVEVEGSQMLEEESFSYNFSKQNEENCKSEQSGSTAGSISETTVQKIPLVSFQEMPTFSTENNHTCNKVLKKVNESFQSQSRQVGDSSSNIEAQAEEHNPRMPKVLQNPKYLGLDVTEGSSTIDISRNVEVSKDDHNNIEASKVMKQKMRKEKQKAVDWDSLRKQVQSGVQKRERTSNTMDSLDWEAVRCADVDKIANTIKERGMNNMLAERMKDFLNRVVRDHGSIDLEWLRDVPPDKAKEYLLSIRGLGLKSVECVRLLTLHHLAFPVDTNVGRIAVRLGWVPLQPLPESLQLHLLELYPVLESIQKYLWPRLCKLDQRTLYELHYQMITFGKVFCTKSKPNCNACPMRGECRHFASAFASARLALPGPEEKSIVSASESKATNQNHTGIIHPLQLQLPQTNQQSGSQSVINNSEPIIEVPATPEPIIEIPATPEPENTMIPETDIEDTYEDPEEIPTIKLNIEEFTQNLQNYMQQNMELQECDMSKALVALTPEAASIPMPKLKNLSRLRTEHQVYELPDSHPLLEGLDKREPDDPCPYLLAIWTPGETANSIQPPERRCSSQEFGNLCDEMTCFSCNSIREANSQIVRGTLLIPCRTAMRGSFPLNGTYFQVNEVFADHNSSINPIDIPRSWIWNLPRRTVYFGTSIPTIFKGLSTEGIQYCFWRGFVCVRGFDQKTRAPRPLMARLHFPASKLTRTKGKTDDT